MELHGILIVDKPRGISSHDVVARVRRLLGTRRVGHAGTLDPAAEGVLILGVGRATKLLDTVQAGSKEYAATILLGARSVSGDIEGPFEEGDPNVIPRDQDVAEALARFVGAISQTPPTHSAIKVGGQPLYRSAARGIEVDVPERQVVISSIRALAYTYPALEIFVACSPGTYVRALARDIGDALGTGAYLQALLRTRSGRFSLDDSWNLAELERSLSPASFAQVALHPDAALAYPAALSLGGEHEKAWYDGRPVPGSAVPAQREHAAAFGHDGRWLGVARWDPAGSGWQPKLVVGGG